MAGSRARHALKVNDVSLAFTELAPTRLISSERRRLVWLFPLLLLTLAPLLPTEVDTWSRLAIVLVAAFSAFLLTTEAAARPSRSGRHLLLLALPALLVATWWGADAAGARDRLADFALLAIAFRAGRDLLGRAGRRAMWSAMALVGGLTALHGLYQRAFGFPIAIRWLEGSGLPEAPLIALRMETGRVFSTFLLPSSFAGFLILSLPVTVSLWLRGSLRGRWKTLVLLSGLAQASALVLTYSHGALLALSVALVLLSWCSSTPVLRRAGLAAAGFTFVLLVAVVFLRGESMTGAGAASHPLGERWGNWQVALHEISDRPWTGVGWGAYGAAYPQYQEAGMNQTRFAHNSYLQLLAEGGLLTAPFLFLFLVWAGRRFARLGPGEQGMGVALVATLVHNLVDFTLLLPGIGIPFFMMVGHLASSEPRGASKGVRNEKRFAPIAAWVLALALPAVAVPAALAREYALAAREQVVRGQSARALESIRHAAWLDPLQADFPDFRARWELEHGDGSLASRNRALDAARQATRLAPRTPHHHSTLEAACTAVGDLACAYREASRAAALFPNSDEYRLRLERYVRGEATP